MTTSFAKQSEKESLQNDAKDEPQTHLMPGSDKAQIEPTAPAIITTDKLIENLDNALATLGGATHIVADMAGRIASNEKIGIARKYAPLGLETAFQELHSVLFSCLCQGDSTAASAILMGPRGSGKSLLLERCLSACLHQSPNTKFRRVQLNGIIVRGDDVTQVIMEIIRQLSDQALREGRDYDAHDNGDDKPPAKKRSRKDRLEDHLLRLRKSSFASNLALLESTFKVAEADGVPILIVLDELDLFADYGQRQLLLYHLLDRVATPGSNLCFVGLTSSFSALSVWEKRIQSRAEGTSKVIYVRPPKTYEAMVKLLSQKMDQCYIQEQLRHFMLAPEEEGEVEQAKAKDGACDAQTQRIRDCMEHEFHLGKDVRWFFRVITSTVSLYRYDCFMSDENTEPPLLRIQHVRDALVSLGASLSDQSRESSSSGQKIAVINGLAIVPRHQALIDLSVPQATVLLCARRILARDSHRDDIVSPLSIQRILREYELYKGTKLPIEGAAEELIERGLLRPSSDHSGGGSLQYGGSISYKSLDRATLHRLPLHTTVDTEREFLALLNKDMLDVPTRLKEWGKRVN